MHSDPLAYFITYRTHGTWLPGDDRGSTRHSPDCNGNKSHTANPSLNVHTGWHSANAVTLDHQMRDVVTHKIAEVCEHYDWVLIALNVRSNHVHIVVQGDKKPEQMMNAFKSWSTRRLRERGLMRDDVKVWARHGSTRYLFYPREVEYAAWYTNEAQDGERFDPDSAVES